ncbi:hypothetical protein Tco_1059965, partial [Tanacetum coccineum]
VEYSGDHDSEDEVEYVDNEMVSYLASKASGVGYGTNSMLEQWRKTYGNVEFNYEPYDDDMYEGHKISDNLRSICDNSDINIRDFCRTAVVTAVYIDLIRSLNMRPKDVVKFSLWLVPSCCVIFDLELLSLSFDFVFDFEIFKSFPCLSLSSLPSCDLVS